MRSRPIHPVPGVYPPTPDYVHAAEVTTPERWVFVAGTMGLDAGGRPGAGIDEQLDLVWDNLERILDAADMTIDDIVRLTTYLTDAAHAERNGAVRVERLGGRAIPTTAIVVETLSAGWLVEIEVIAGR